MQLVEGEVGGVGCRGSCAPAPLRHGPGLWGRWVCCAPSPRTWWGRGGKHRGVGAAARRSLEVGGGDWKIRLESSPTAGEGGDCCRPPVVGSWRRRLGIGGWVWWEGRKASRACLPACTPDVCVFFLIWAMRYRGYWATYQSIVLNYLLL
jgi:hypothetical protein